MILGDYCHVGRDASIVAKYGRITIGNRCFIGHGSTIACSDEIAIGTDCLIGEYVTIRDQNHGMDCSDVPFAQQGMESASIMIGDNVWIGAKATIVAGVKIASNSVVAANAVVTRDVAPWTVVGGVPARHLRNLDSPEDCIREAI
ncbi:MAG: acyltransferase [Rhodopirellula sp.]|nr:acyltransferase [Rhodopirellula sp.]